MVSAITPSLLARAISCAPCVNTVGAASPQRRNPRAIRETGHEDSAGPGQNSSSNSQQSVRQPHSTVTIPAFQNVSHTRVSQESGGDTSLGHPGPGEQKTRYQSSDPQADSRREKTANIPPTDQVHLTASVLSSVSHRSGVSMFSSDPQVRTGGCVSKSFHSPAKRRGSFPSARNEEADYDLKQIKEKESLVERNRSEAFDEETRSSPEVSVPSPIIVRSSSSRRVHPHNSIHRYDSGSAHPHDTNATRESHKRLHVPSVDPTVIGHPPAPPPPAYLSPRDHGSGASLSDGMIAPSVGPPQHAQLNVDTGSVQPFGEPLMCNQLLYTYKLRSCFFVVFIEPVVTGTPYNRIQVPLNTTLSGSQEQSLTSPSGDAPLGLEHTVSLSEYFWHPHPHLPPHVLSDTFNFRQPMEHRTVPPSGASSVCDRDVTRIDGTRETHGRPSESWVGSNTINPPPLVALPDPPNEDLRVSSRMNLKASIARRRSAHTNSRSVLSGYHPPSFSRSQPSVSIQPPPHPPPSATIHHKPQSAGSTSRLRKRGWSFIIRCDCNIIR